MATKKCQNSGLPIDECTCGYCSPEEVEERSDGNKAFSPAWQSFRASRGHPDRESTTDGESLSEQLAELREKYPELPGG